MLSFFLLPLFSSCSSLLWRDSPMSYKMASVNILATQEGTNRCPCSFFQLASFFFADFYSSSFILFFHFYHPHVYFFLNSYSWRLVSFVNDLCIFLFYLNCLFFFERLNFCPPPCHSFCCDVILLLLCFIPRIHNCAVIATNFRSLESA